MNQERGKQKLRKKPGNNTRQEYGLMFVDPELQPPKQCLIKQITSPTKAVCEVLQYNRTMQTKAFKDGIESEEQTMVISESHPFLGASPDGIIDNETIVEVKKIRLKDVQSDSEVMCRLGNV